MKPTEGRKRVIIEEIQPNVDAGRYPAKRVLGDTVEVTAAIFGDGHDHIGARLLFRHSSERTWQTQYSTFRPLGNDIWSAVFTVDKIGLWYFTIEAWVDHFDTWVDDLGKRLAAQDAGTQDIPLALTIGANHLDTLANRARSNDRKTLKEAAKLFRSLATQALPRYDSPVTPMLIELAAKYPNTALITRYETELPLWVDRKRARYSSWYEIFPRSTSAIEGKHGTFRDLETRLPEIAAMGFDVLYLPPVHPIGEAFRKGRNNAVTAQTGDVGSPWAIGNTQAGTGEGGHLDVHPELGTFDDFASLLKATRLNGLELALDIAFQCSPDHPWVNAHPDWFTKRPDGTIQYAENPPKKYQDIYPLNFESSDWKGLWDALYGVFKFWVDRGVRIFRVDNPHTKALPFWEWCIAEVQKSVPETIFLAEAFTRPHVMYSLAKAGFTQSYTYFTWRNDKQGLEAYFGEICNPPVSDFFRPNVWPNTPDILHAQFQVADDRERRAMFMARAILAATLSANWGIYGPAYELCEGRPGPVMPGRTGSEEYLDSEKYQLRSWDRSSPLSIAPLLTLLNRIRYDNLALQANENLHTHTTDNGQIICYSKSLVDPVTREVSGAILVVVNLDAKYEQTAWIDLQMDKLGLPWDDPFEVRDMLTNTTYTWEPKRNFVILTPVTSQAHIFRIVR